MIRTMQRNNIDLKHIADNKANILLSLNALMITFLIPIVFNNLDIILTEYLIIPLVILFVTCLTTIILAGMVLKPFDWLKVHKDEEARLRSSPFFFVNYYKKSFNDFISEMDKSMNDPDRFKENIMADMYFMGRILGAKYYQIGLCYDVFMTGIILTVVSSGIILLFF